MHLTGFPVLGNHPGFMKRRPLMVTSFRMKECSEIAVYKALLVILGTKQGNTIVSCIVGAVTTMGF